MGLAARPSKAWDVADLVDERLHVLPNPLAAWNSDPFWVSVCDSDPGQVLVSLHVPRVNAQLAVQLRIGFPVTGESPGIQAERILAALRQPHPLAGAVVCGGDRECAEEYGYAWPPSLDEELRRALESSDPAAPLGVAGLVGGPAA
ncbi:hypothetical protein [Streptomyces sp. MST-110588]|uniref:hypothetical protein n=1 Tax=Streptomyces sp. MST-110588 TaxID=2833628 RepID=UPI001F5DEA1A|nr:hypothetical protein [Streptomyces sp. MST-110588]UNO42365.1 hypothetical protein KGS77_26115 [Streptomyces sp. MST-110588]